MGPTPAGAKLRVPLKEVRASRQDVEALTTRDASLRIFTASTRASSRVEGKPRTMPAQRPGLSRQTFGTPEPFIAAVKKRFGVREFYYDLAASPENTKGRFHFCKEEDTLKQDWNKLASRQLWLNPEFANIAPYAKKCTEFVQTGALNGGRLFFLTPASVGANWFADFVHNKAAVFALQGRLSFDGIGPYPKDLILSVYGPPRGFDVWDWRKDVPTTVKKGGA